MSRTARLSSYYRKAAPTSCFTGRVDFANRVVKILKERNAWNNPVPFYRTSLYNLFMGL